MSPFISAIWESKLNIYDFVVDVYKIGSFADHHMGVITPMPSPEKWPSASMSVIYPPKFTALPGRPKKKRRKSTGELAPGATKASRVSQINCCGNCGGRGHTRRTFKNTSSSKPKVAKKMGRPLKAEVTPATLRRRERRALQRAREAAQAPPPSQPATLSTPRPPLSQANC